ncbi:MAG: universal stress protein [Desulfobacterales bacterium]|nr:universal stress protein [Desulfobacterales bacterium]
MFKNILVPVDFSKKNTQTLDIAMNLAFKSKGKVTLLHIIEIISDTTFNEFQEFYLTLEKRSQQDMTSLVAPHEKSSVDIETKIVYGNRTREILRHAENNNIDLIVLHSHKIDFNEPTLGWGTISHKVGILSQCPVMLVK